MGDCPVRRVSIRLWGFGFWVCLLGFGLAMEGPGFSFRRREASLVRPCVSVVTWQTSENFSPEGISTTSFGSTHSEGWGTRFLATVAGFMGISEGNDGGDFSKGVIARGFLARCERS